MRVFATSAATVCDRVILLNEVCFECNRGVHDLRRERALVLSLRKCGTVHQDEICVLIRGDHVIRRLPECWILVFGGGEPHRDHVTANAFREILKRITRHKNHRPPSPRSGNICEIFLRLPYTLGEQQKCKRGEYWMLHFKDEQRTAHNSLAGSAARFATDAICVGAVSWFSRKSGVYHPR